ncbi:MAG: dihydroorotase [Ruthenibacterium sp.]
MLIKNVRLANGAPADILIENGVIAAVGENLSLPVGTGKPHADSTAVLNANGCTALPAFVDLHCHFRTPGFEYKEDIESGSRAAARGGYTMVNCMANTKPVCSSAAIAQSVMDEAERIGLCRVNQCVSLTKDFDGASVGHLNTLPRNLRCVSDDGKGVQNNRTLWHAMQIAARRDLLIMSHAEDMEISPEDYRLAENIETARNILLAEYTGARLHLCHVSTKEAMAEILAAKARGVRVTCEVTPHHIWFADTDYRVNPPIREKADVDFLIEAMKNGGVDAIATDHAPHSPEDKAGGAPGMVGLETAFSVCYTKLCVQNGLPLSALSRMLSENPAKLLCVNKGALAAGYDGDVVLVELKTPYTVRADDFAGKSHNTPYDGLSLYGRVMTTIKGGRVTYRAADAAAPEVPQCAPPTKDLK